MTPKSHAGSSTTTGNRSTHSYLTQQQRMKLDHDLDEEDDLSRRSSRAGSSRLNSNEDDIFKSSQPASSKMNTTTTIRQESPKVKARTTSQSHSPMDSLELNEDEKIFQQFRNNANKYDTLLSMIFSHGFFSSF